ncbi:MAG: alcohol dehydrogenase catalytic domain-containing protein [Actinobacteria bacterium]|nr:alcohol dehydrogenase catalytic domain-containing protein [Actinomycetota bacterium]
MKCAMLVKPFELKIKEIEKPILKRGEVLIRTKMTGICGSDVHAYKGQHPKRVPPVVLGHEMVGMVERITPDVKFIKVGDRVTVNPQIVCGKCESCKKGKQNLCNSKILLGTKEWPGSYAEYISAPAEVVFKLPKSISDEEGTMVEPLAVAIHTIKKVEAPLGNSCLIFGSGTIGLMCLLSAKASGFTDILITDIVDYKLKIAEALGATLALNSNKENIVETVRRYTDNRGVDTIFIAAGTQTVVDDSLKCVAKEGSIFPIAQFGGVPVEFSMADIRYKETKVIGTTMYLNEDILTAINLLEKKIIDVKPLITHKLPIEKIQRGIDLVDRNLEEAVKVVLKF